MQNLTTEQKKSNEFSALKEFTIRENEFFYGDIEVFEVQKMEVPYSLERYKEM